MSIERIVIVTRKTRLQDNIQHYNTIMQARFVIESRGHSFSDYELEDANYARAREIVMSALPAGIKFQVIDRSYLPDYLFLPGDLVIVLGQDGLVVNTAKYLQEQAIVGVNPDPDRFDGVLLPFQSQELIDFFHILEKGSSPQKKLTMARVSLNDGQELLAFNDFFIGPRSHTSARYTITHRERRERQSSSGIIVSTPAGSTGWLSSLFNMARGMAGANATEETSSPLASPVLNWEERRLMFVVREPFASKWSGTSVVTGEILEEERLILESHMPEEGVIFSDGVLDDYLEFNSGATASIALAQKTSCLYVKDSS